MAALTMEMRFLKFSGHLCSLSQVVRVSLQNLELRQGAEGSSTLGASRGKPGFLQSHLEKMILPVGPYSCFPTSILRSNCGSPLSYLSVGANNLSSGGCFHFGHPDLSCLLSCSSIDHFSPCLIYLDKIFLSH